MCYFGDDYVCYMDDTVGECVVGWQLGKSVRLGRFVDQVMVNAQRVFVSLSVVGLKKKKKIFLFVHSFEYGIFEKSHCWKFGERKMFC